MPEKDSKFNSYATKVEIAGALKTWGSHGAPSAQEKALALLEAQPMSALVQVLPSLWRSEYKGPSETARLSPLQQGILRFCCRHPSSQFVPVLVETLTVREDIPIEFRSFLTELLPLWCNESSSPLTVEQRAILLADLERFLFRNVGFLRRVFAPANHLSDEEANYCLAILQTLRHEAMRNGSLKLDKEVVTVLQRLPYAVATDDLNCDSVLDTAQLLLQESQQ